MSNIVNPTPAGGAPDPHAASHADGGSDEVALDASQITTGTFPTARIADDAITGPKLRNSVGNSVIGFAGAIGGNPADIVASAANTFLTRRGVTVQFDNVAPTDLFFAAIDRFIVSEGVGFGVEKTFAQVTALLDVFTSALKGLVPASGGGTTNFLRADGVFAAPGGGSGADPPEGSYEPGSYTVATGKFRNAVKRQQFTTTQRLTLQGTARLSVQN